VNRFATLAIEHLLLRLRPLNRALRRAVEVQSGIADQLIRPEVAALCVTDDQVLKLLDGVDGLFGEGQSRDAIDCLTPDEQAIEEELRERSASIKARLPLKQLAQALDLTAFEEEAILLCAAPEIDRAYERVYAYILDDLNRRFPCVELLSSLTSTSPCERLSRRHILGRFGKLQRTGLLRPQGEAATELRQELRLAPGLLEFLTGASEKMDGIFFDPADVFVPERVGLPPTIEMETIRRLGQSIHTGHVSVVGVWGARHAGQEECVLALASAAKMPLRHLLISELERAGANLKESLREMLQMAVALGAILWTETDSFNEPEHERLREAIVEALIHTRIPIFLTGVHPWRPTRLFEASGYAELELGVPGYQARQMMWSRALPEIDASRLNDLAARFRLSNAEMRAVAQVARTRAVLNGNGHAADVGDQLDAACAAVTRKRSAHFATLVKPRRTPGDLILAPGLHQQVLEVAKFFRAWPRVDEEWGFAHLASGNGGIKALITGESGTGKTLAAEIIAGALGLPMLKVDLSRVVSKWVGETERNLEMVFREAEESHSVLTFDECETLFGKRGEVQSGTDRYSNLEVGYLLQRLEDYYGLVILTSNLKDQIDSAFTRRFQVVLHFPLPGPEERRRIWQIAFPKTAPLDSGVNLDVLEQLDLTGAGIVGAARTAALLAADEESESIRMSHVIQAVERQYQREARVLTTAQLGPYATLIQGAAF